ncbi:MAG: SDR family oxidoreductase [Acidobacteriota bacterium]
MPQRVLICGGGGFVGTVLARRLLSMGHEVRVLDTFWFGDFLGPHDRLIKIRGDMRDGELVDRAVDGVESVIQLACLSNDPTSDLDAGLTRAINYDACADVIHRAKAAGVRRFIYASSASVYGVRDEPDITEQMDLAPITLYSQYKAEIEQVLFDAGSDRFTTVAVRNSTVCGVSPRMRLDLIISIFVMVAMKKGVITIEGGTQLRPLIHIEDLLDLYELLLDADRQKIDRQAFNISSNNYPVLDVARMVQARIPCRLEFASFTDPRSYHVSTDKARRVLGYRATRPIEASIDEIKDAFDRSLIDETDRRSYNIRHIKHLLETVPDQVFFTGGRTMPVA